MGPWRTMGLMADKHNIGDIVHITKTYCDKHMSKGMLQYLDTDMTIAGIDERYAGDAAYLMHEDHGAWLWWDADINESLTHDNSAEANKRFEALF